MEEKILELIEELGASKYKKGVDWNGYQVYIPEYEGNPCIGLPYVVLVKGEEVRLSNEEESLEYLDYEQDHEMGNKSAKELSNNIRYQNEDNSPYIEVEPK